MKKICSLFLLALLPLVANADDVNINGIMYSLDNNDNTAIVNGLFKRNYSGDLNIPASVTYQDTEYTVTVINNSAFRNCAGLTSVTISNGITTIAMSAFRDCTGLISVDIPNSVTSIQMYAFDGCTQLSSVFIPSNVTSIEEATFFGCSSLMSLTISDGVTSIGRIAFGNCSDLTSIIIPSSVTSIGQNAFAWCNNLASVWVDIATPLSIDEGTFYDVSNATLYVPIGSVEAYQNATNWSDFFDIKEYIEPVSVTISDLGMATYCSEYDLDFTGISGIKAYIASGFNPTTGIVFIMHVNEVPANTGIMLKGTPGTYSIPCKETNMYYVNMLKGTLEAMTVPATSDGYKNYVLANGDDGLLFYGSLGGSTLDANRAYLQIPLSVVQGVNAARMVYIEEQSNATGISSPISIKENKTDNIFNLNGQRVTSPKKGLYIRNGKKIIIH